MLDNVKRKGRSIIFAIEGTDELRYLNTNQANANVGGELLTHIIGGVQNQNRTFGR